MKILVVAPRFPSISQPWIDTYLEQLLRCSIEPSIYSASRAPFFYHSKVDQLGLRKRVIQLSLSKKLWIRSFFRQLSQPASMACSWYVSKPLAISGVGRLVSWMKCVHFSEEGQAIASVDLVHSHAEHLAYDFLHLAVMHNVPLVLTFHGFPPAGIGQLTSEKRTVLYRFAALILVNTVFAKKQVCSLGCDPAKVCIIPQGLPLADFPFSAREAPIGNAKLRLLTVGRYDRDKGQGYALLALRRLLNMGVQLHWYFVGSGPEKSRLERLAARLQLGQHLSFHENLSSDQLRQLYQDCHFFVLPSISGLSGHVETQGVVLLEAQASGCIPIASRVGGIPECINDRQDALLVKEKSSRSIVEAVQYMLSRPDEWSAYQQAGRYNVERNFSADVIGRKMAYLLQEVVIKWEGYGTS